MFAGVSDLTKSLLYIMSKGHESGAGRIKALVTIVQFFFLAISGAAKFVDSSAATPTILLAFFTIYVVTDVLWWRQHVWVWMLGPLSIAVAIYWWLGFMANQGFPAAKILPERFLPTSVAYCGIACWLVGYAIWDIVDARINEYSDERFLDAGAVFLIISVLGSLSVSLGGPNILSLLLLS